MTRLVGAGLLASAFAPLVLLLAVLRLPDLQVWGWVLIAGSVAAMLLLVGVLRTLARVQQRHLESTTVRHADESVLKFTSTYLVPAVVVTFGGQSWATSVATGGLVVLLAVVYVRGALYHLNPVLALAGFRLYEVTDRSGRPTMLLTRADHLPQAGVIRCRLLAGDTAIQLRRDQ